MLEIARGEESIWERLSRLSEKICDRCGGVNNSRDNTCRHCHTPFGAEEPEKPFEIMAAEGAFGAGWVTQLEEKNSFQRIRKAYELIRSGALPSDEYRQILSAYISRSGALITLFATEAVRRKAETLPQEEVDIVRSAIDGYEKLNDGLIKMSASGDTCDLLMLDQGFFLVQEAMIALIDVQERAYEIVSRN